MRRFHIGDRVRCIDDVGTPDDWPALTEGEWYTVVRIAMDSIGVRERLRDDYEKSAYLYMARRFDPAQEWDE